jgi:hypothetical protein
MEEIFNDCIRKCEICKYHCEGMNGMELCVKACSDCIQCCKLCLTCKFNEKELYDHLLKMCVRACEMCANACRMHPSMPVCVECVKACDQCIIMCNGKLRETTQQKYMKYKQKYLSLQKM